MKLLINIFLTILFCYPKSEDAIPLKCMVEMIEYRGEGAYFSISVINRNDEYLKTITTKKLNSNVITPTFKEFKNGSYKTIAIYAKKARGLMSRFIIENKLEDIDNLKIFNSEGYTFDENLSDLSNYTFVR